jgi:hypothetical protein
MLAAFVSLTIFSDSVPGESVILELAFWRMMRKSFTAIGVLCIGCSLVSGFVFARPFEIPIIIHDAYLTSNRHLKPIPDRKIGCLRIIHENEIMYSPTAPSSPPIFNSEVQRIGPLKL